MLGIVKAEILKSKRTMGRKLIFIFPLITFIMALLVTGGLQNAYAECVWNWWYILILPMLISILCYLTSASEKKSKFFHMTTLETGRKDLMMGKILYLGLVILLANTMIFAVAAVVGKALSTHIPFLGGLAFVFVLTLTQLWEIPLFLFLSMKFGMVVNLMTALVITVAGILIAPTGKWMFVVSSVPMRLAIPMLHLLPSGLKVAESHPLADLSAIPVGMIESVVVLAVAAWLFLRWFDKREV